MKIFYLCDRRACEKCNAHCGGETECKHTTDIQHAVNFEMKGESMWERERCELISEETLELPGLFIDDERLEKIEGYLAKLVDANGKAVELPKVNIKCDSPGELAAEVGRLMAEGLKQGPIS